MDIILRLLQAGVDVVRLNFSHGTHEDHAQIIAHIRSICSLLDRPVTILQDLQGPKIRTGEIEGGQVQLDRGEEVTLTTQHIIGNKSVIPVDFSDLTNCVEPGGRILLDDGNLELVVLSTAEDQLRARVVLGGVLKPHKGVNLPGAKLNISSLTEKDEKDLAFGLQQGVDAIALSFVRQPHDIAHLRHIIGHLAPDRKDIPIIAKLERAEALDNLDKIVEIADGVMVARGDLGVEMSPEAVPIAQKQIIDSANRQARVVITATQMLDSMMHSPRPTRAEASDVANAIFDGTDAVMLSGETAAGEYPLKSVEMMDTIVNTAERYTEEYGHYAELMPPDSGSDDTFFVTQAAYTLAHDRNVAAIAVFTTSGRTARLMSKTRPKVPILAFTPHRETYHRMALYWGVTPYLAPHAPTVQEMLVHVEHTILSTTGIQRGQQVVVTCGYPVNEVGPTKMTLIHTVGEAGG